MIPRQFFRLLADEDVRVKLLGRAFQPGGQVHAVAQHGEFHALRMANIADDDIAMIYTDANGIFFPLWIVFPSRI